MMILFIVVRDGFGFVFIVIYCWEDSIVRLLGAFKGEVIDVVNGLI